MWLQLHKVGLQIVTFRVSKLILLNMNFFKVPRMQDLLIFSSSMPNNSSNWWAILKLIIKLVMQVVVEMLKTIENFWNYYRKKFHHVEIYKSLV